MNELDDAKGPLWAARLIELCARLRAAPASRESVRTEVWTLVRDALCRYLGAYRGRFAAASLEDLEDLASGKALDLLRRAESGEWSVEGRHPSEVAGYVARVARNSLLRLGEYGRRTIALESDPHSESGRAIPTDAVPVESEVEAGEFARHLRTCVDQLQPRARRVWFYRVFYEMKSRDIAAHPGVGLQASHVDVIVHRTRDVLRSCLGGKGLDAADPPPGVFARLWDWLCEVEARVNETESESLHGA